MARIGFVGLGKMGASMARNLLKAGHQVAGFDLVADAVAAFAAEGGTAAPSGAEAARGADFVVTMLPAGPQVRDAILGAGGIAAASPAGAVLIDSSTIDVATARDLAAQCGRAMLDAPVSGGTLGAEAATLTFMVGGQPEVFERARPILAAMGKTLVLCGAAGAGQAVKACNNMMLAASMIVTAEALVMAERLGLTHQAVFDVVSKSTGQTFALTGYAPVPGLVPTSPANRGYAPGFSAALMAKDLGLARDAAASVGLEIPVGGTAQALFARFLEEGGGALDFSAIIRLIRGEAAAARPDGS